MSTTHEVVNQAPPREGLNEYLTNPALTEAVKRFDAQWAADGLTEVGALVGRPDFQHDAELAHTQPPRLSTHDRWGNRVDTVEYHPAYHRILGAAVEHGAHTSCWADPRPGAHVARAATFMLFAQVEPGHACPMSMTHAVVPSLRLAPELAEQWLPRVYARGYDPAPRAPEAKASALFGMAMTEKQGGSDVRANTTRAADAGDGTYLLTGHKWFCSAPSRTRSSYWRRPPVASAASSCPGCCRAARPMCSASSGSRTNWATVRTPRPRSSWTAPSAGWSGKRAGESAPSSRWLPRPGWTASSAAPPECGRPWPRPPGTPGTAAPSARSSSTSRMMTAVIADLQLEAEAATWTAIRLAAAYDTEDAESVAFRRLATAVAKYWVCKRGPHHAYEALECLGGNGYTEAFPLARRYREQPVMAIWEGSGNVIALDVLRAMAREPESVEAVDRELASALGVHPAYDAHIATTRTLLGRTMAQPDRAPAQARRLVEALALALQGAVLIREAPAAVADAFVAARLGADRSLEYGALAPGLDLASLVSRA